MSQSGSEPLRDVDLVKWLDNKLGDSNELWSGRQASSLLTKEMLLELESCFEALEPHVKLKIIQAIPHLSPKIVQLPLQVLLELGRRDADDWVQTISDMYRDFPETGCIRSVPTNQESHFYKTLTSLHEIVKSQIDDKALNFVPPDMSVCSHSSIRVKYGFAEVEKRKDFQLRGKPRSYILKQDLIRASEHLNNPANKKSNGLITSFPIKIRSTAKKLNNTLPMKAITTPSTTLKLSGGFTNEPKKFQRSLPKREGGAKMIDISEIPQPLKRRRGTIEIIEPKKLSKEEMKPMIKPLSSPKKQNSPQKTNVLSSPATLQDYSKPEAKEEEGPYQPLSRPGRVTRTETMDSDMSTHSFNDAEAKASAIAKMKQEFRKFVSQNSSSPQDQLPRNNANNASMLSPEIKSPEIRSPQLFREQLSSPPQQPMPQINLYQSQMPTSQQQPTPQQPHINLYMLQQPIQQPIQQQQTQMEAQAAYQAQLQQAVRQQCEELCKNANKLMPSGFNLIYSFMSGNKDHPFAGNDVVTLQLSESVEDERLNNGMVVKALVETYFQMDYRTGEWKRLRKSRLLKPEEMVKFNVQPQQQNFPGMPVIQNQVGTSQPQPQSMNFSMNFR